jgi:L-ascorbate metabolism protein UlaG (beta-lactamase superfamily)
MKFVRSSAVKLANQINPKYVIPIHFDCPWTVDPEELRERLTAEVVLPRSFVELRS